MSGGPGNRLAGMNAVVTGGTRGIGFAIARRLVQEHAVVIVTGRQAAATDHAASVLTAGGPGRALGVPCDVRDDSSVSALAAIAVDLLGPIDVLVNNAGVATLHRFVELPAAEWDRVFAVNARGSFLCGQAFAAHMLDRGSGSIINISSQAGYQGQSLVGHYCASKAAVLGLTKAMALELAPQVRVNAVCPGIVETEMIESDFRQQGGILGIGPNEVRRRSLARIPLGRFQDAASVAGVVAFLASDDSRDITGQALHVNGGMTTC